MPLHTQHEHHKNTSHSLHSTQHHEHTTNTSKYYACVHAVSTDHDYHRVTMSGSDAQRVEYTLHIGVCIYTIYRVILSGSCLECPTRAKYALCSLIGRGPDSSLTPPRSNVGVMESIRVYARTRSCVHLGFGYCDAHGLSCAHVLCVVHMQHVL